MQKYRYYELACPSFPSNQEYDPIHTSSCFDYCKVQLEATIIHVSEIGRVIICDGTHIVKCSLLKKEEIESVCIGQVVKVLAIAATSDFELGYGLSSIAM